jgi:hypothetical protein
LTVPDVELDPFRKIASRSRARRSGSPVRRAGGPLLRTVIVPIATAQLDLQDPVDRAVAAKIFAVVPVSASVS